MERSAQLMRAGGVAGIVLPISVLNKGGIYARAREIILENFDIVSLAEFGSGTFGKTGTNTVVLFLRRKETNTPAAEHYRNRVKSWFDTNDNAEDIYQDEHLLQAYCDHCGYGLEDYRTFLKDGTINEMLFETEVFKAYYESFDSTDRNAMKGVCDAAKEIRNRFRERTKKQTFRLQTDAQKKAEKEKALRNFIISIEREKIYIFLLAFTVDNSVLIVKSPTTTATIKKFLGYGWSDSKGNEGIEYLHLTKTKSENDDEGDDDDTVQQIRGINGIRTPLFNPDNLYDSEKINTLIRKNFLNEDVVIPEDLSEIVSQARLVDMIDFKQTAFDKTIKTSIALQINVESKYDIIPLKKFVIAINPSRDEFHDIDGKTLASFVEMSSLGLGTIKNKIDRPISEISLGGYTNFRENDVLVAKITPCMENGKCALAENLTNQIGFGSTEFHVIRASNKERAKYVLEFINREYIRKVAASNMTGASGHRRVPQYFYEQMPIPDAPQEIIKSIVIEAEAVDKEVKKARKQIENAESEIEQAFSNATKNATKILRLNDSRIFNLSIGRRVVSNEVVQNGRYLVVSANVHDEFGRINHSVLDDFSVPSILWGIDGDWMVNYIEKNILFAPTDHCGVIRVLDETEILPKYLTYPLFKAGERERFSRANRASTERVRSLTITVPDIDTQKDVVAKVKECETLIAEAKSIIGDSAKRKQEILDKYLK